jgi:LytS/YehU family sensor histidine kinase
MMLAWHRIAGFGPDWDTIRMVTLMCVICVVFITHVYETAYLIRQRESDLLAVERLERLRAEAELEALKGQVAPHFLFNTLNALSWLIENNPRKALHFNQDLAEVYRYILVARRRELVPLEEELAFLKRYFSLLVLRFESAVALELPPAGARPWFVPPISLQVLVENAVKHNSHPLRIEVLFEEDAVVVANEKRPRAEAAPSARMGLATLDERCRLAMGRGIQVRDEDGRFAVRLPVKVA